MDRSLLRNALTGTLLFSLVVRAFAAEDAASAHPHLTLEEVIVTAQKRSENLQRTSAAITAVAGKEVVAAGITDIRGAQNFVPSVRFQAENANTEIYVRGVGSTLDLPNIEPPTSFNMNGIYIPREATSVALFDIAQLEVLPGPQGTLYGRSSLGGTVNVTAQRPNSELESIALFEGGSDSLFHGGFVQNLPITDQFALRGAFDYLKRDGVQKTGADSNDDFSARLSGLYEPSDHLSVLVWAQGTKKKGRSPNLVRKGFNGGTFDGDPNAFDTSDAWNDVITPDAPTAAKQDYENLVLGAQVDYVLGDTTFTWLPSYLYLDWAGNYWLENLPSFLSAHYNQVTQELRASGSFGDKWRWLSGVYGYRVTNDGRFVVNGFPLAN
ncbi:MAG TPA: TonB-dependent receptor plug domain-containing protein, partial [Povalibacter sp.]